jgi:Tfp pilus assembly protein PilF
MNSFRIAGVAAVIAALLALAADAPVDNRLWEYRNLGKAFYENPDTHLQAVEQLKAALQLRPESVRERINYGLALLRAGQTEAGTAELIKAQQQDSSIPHTWFNLGIVYKRAGDWDKAIAEFQGMIRLVPNDAVSHYNLAAVYRSKGDVETALNEFRDAERLNPDLAGPHFQLFTLYQRARDAEQAAKERTLFEEAKKRNEGAAVPEDMEWNFYAELYDPPEARPAASDEPAKYDDKIISRGWDAQRSGALVIDTNRSGHPDLLVWSPERVQLFKAGTDPVKSGLDDLRGVRNISAGDFDNDGLPDLCVITDAGATIYRNAKGTFTEFAKLPNTAGVTAGLWLDYDHDYDLDLLLFGRRSVLMRNDGNGKFEDKTVGFPFVNGQATDAVAFAVRGDTAARDVIVSYTDHPAVLYTDKLNGRFEPANFPELPPGATDLSIQDFNHDGLLDLVSYRPEMRMVVNTGNGFAQVKSGHALPHAVTADFNGDNRADFAQISSDGSLHLLLNASSNQRWMTVAIRGVKNNKDGSGATVEVKSGAYYSKKVYSGVALPFAADDRADIDTVRITWPNGLIQNETRQKITALNIEEAQRLSGSCPMIFTWNGAKFQFITDVLGVAPLGASSGDGNYFPVNHSEHIQIPASALKPENGHYDVHITEELHEVSYLDQVQLVAVDHPSSTEIYTNDKFKSPPYPEFRLFGSAEKIHPVHAIDAHGVDATARVAKIDHTYPDAFSRNSSGVAELHTLDLDFGHVAAANKAALVLNGWVDWADGSTFLGASQNATGLIFPYLQVKDTHGKWKTVVEDMGIPSGKPKTIVVDLAGRFLSASREVRIVTNLCVYWDEIFLIEDSGAARVHLTPIDANTARLHFRGFSRPVIDPNRQQPEAFLYDQVRPISNWNPTPGHYTRYGDVLPLVGHADDRMVIMGSGDELTLEYPTDHLPELPSGWTRDFLLSVDGWAKDADANTAFSQSVLPLPFHGMSAYPYKSTEHFPDDAAHRQYQAEYLTRPALRLIQPLAPAVGAD